MIFRWTFVFLFTLFAGLLFAGSSKPDDYPREELLAAPQSVTIEGKVLNLGTYLWRDFMPISPPDGKPLKTVVKIKTQSGGLLPAGLKANKVWVINQDKQWSGALEQAGRELPSATLTEMELVASGGPKWEPGTRVTVVVELEDEAGNTHLIRAADQPIHRTD